MKTRAKFSQKIKQEIAERDNYLCIICKDNWTTVHHLYFWMNSNWTETRNDVDQWCILCQNCHHNLHNWNWKELRSKCINYVRNEI